MKYFFISLDCANDEKKKIILLKGHTIVNLLFPSINFITIYVSTFRTLIMLLIINFLYNY